MRQRGHLIQSELAPNVIATVHPSSILRARDSASRQLQMKDFVRDLTNIVELLKSARVGRPAVHGSSDPFRPQA
jgi:uracil-DNA glycosylase